METRAPYIVVGSFVLTILVGIFGFVYWVNNAGRASHPVRYRVVFDGPVPGLLKGAAVLFNGIRVGEVIALALDPERPRAVDVTVAVDLDTPVRKDTKVGVEFQGLTGVPVIALEGGSSTLRIGPNETLHAEPGAGLSMTQAARDALRQANTILGQNAEPLRNTISNIQIFAESLARNAPRLDSILAGLDKTMGGGAPKPRATFDLDPAAFPTDPDRKGKTFELPELTAIARLHTQRFLFPPGEEADPSFETAQWSDSLPALVQARLQQSFENYSIQQSPLRDTDAAQSHPRLLIDLRKFEIARSTQPAIVIALSARLVDDNGTIVAGRIFEKIEAIDALQPHAAASAFGHAFQDMARDLVLWTEERL